MGFRILRLLENQNHYLDGRDSGQDLWQGKDHDMALSSAAGSKPRSHALAREGPHSMSRSGFSFAGLLTACFLEWCGALTPAIGETSGDGISDLHNSVLFRLLTTDNPMGLSDPGYPVSFAGMKAGRASSRLSAALPGLVCLHD